MTFEERLARLEEIVARARAATSSTSRARSRCSRKASRICARGRPQELARPRRRCSDSSSGGLATFDARRRRERVRAVDWAADRAAIDRALAALCAARARRTRAALAEAVRYSLLGGGKRLRALLLLAAYRAAGGTGDATLLAAAVEVVHAYSLVHDDLPCMDDDDMRRGRPTVHRVFGVPVATAAGVAMVPLAATPRVRAARALGLPDDGGGEIVAGVDARLGRRRNDRRSAARSRGRGRRSHARELERIHRAKTGALIRASVALGRDAARARARRSSTALGAYGEAIGLAFQIADDVLDVTATTDRLGKTAGRDLDLAQEHLSRAARRRRARRAGGRARRRRRARRSRRRACSRRNSMHLARFVVERES